MDIKMVPRFFINNIPYTMEQLPKEQVAKIVEERMNNASFEKVRKQEAAG